MHTDDQPVTNNNKREISKFESSNILPRIASTTIMKEKNRNYVLEIVSIYFSIF
jgi:hypothetical protein